MSASEKLKALDDLTTYPQGAIARSTASAIRGRRLLDILPQIAAVVEAAEALQHSPYLQRKGIYKIVPLDDALAALDEKLS